MAEQEEETVNQPHGGEDDNSPEPVTLNEDENSNPEGDWYVDSGRQLEDLEKAHAANVNRLAELEAGDPQASVLEAAKAAVEGSRLLLEEARGQKGAAKRPRATKNKTTRS